jgi:putative ABC transport system substrate-binding protein
MKRRRFIALAGGTLVALPLKNLAHALNGPNRVRLIGILTPFADNDPGMSASIALFIKSLQTLGWSTDRNIQIISRHAGGDLGRLQTYARELVKQNPDVIIARSTPVVKALLRETHTIPIIFTQVTDAERQGFVASLSHPGGNVTGFTHFESAIGGKWLELLRELIPNMRKVAVTYNPAAAPFADLILGPIRNAAREFDITPDVLPLEDTAQFEDALNTFGGEPGAGLIVIPDAITGSRRKMIISAAAKLKLPAIYPFRFYAADGGLMSYGSDPTEGFRQAATYVDHIFKGQRPGDLPVQTPMKFEFVINLKTAKSIGIEIPTQLQLLADELIE